MIRYDKAMICQYINILENILRLKPRGFNSECRKVDGCSGISLLP